MLIEIGDYCVLGDQKLGAGSFGEAFKCYHKNNKNLEYCIKIIKKNMNTDPQKEKSQKRQLQAEITTFEQLKNENCENLVKMIEIIDQPTQLCIIMELCDYDLQKELSQLKANKTWLSRLEIMDMMKQILKGAEVLIRNHIIHRDIKPQNILVKILNKGTPTQRKIYKIADFGFSKYLDDIYAKANLTRVGTRSYCAPEIMKGNKFSCKCDIYSYGIVFHQIVYQLSYPNNYETEEQIRQFLNYIQTSPYKCKPLKDQYGDLITNLIDKMLIFDQDQRISFEDLCSHEIYKRPNPILKDSIFLPIERNIDQYDYKKQMLKNEEEKFYRLNLLMDIFYRKFKLCNYFVDFMKKTLIFNNIEFLILQQLIQLIGLQQIIYGFAMMNCLISDLEPTIVNDNDVPQLIELLNQFMKKSQDRQQYVNLQKNIHNDYYYSKATYQADFNKLLLFQVKQNWTQNSVEFQLLQKSKTKKIPMQKCCSVLQEFTNKQNINDWVNKCDKNIKESLQTIKQIDTQFEIAHYRMINPDEIFKI